MLHKVLFLTLIRAFYQANSGFFVLVVLIGFGILRPEEHRFLFLLVSASPISLLIYFALWTFYGIQTVAFVVGQFHRQELSFLYHLRLLPAWQRLAVGLGVQVLLFAPVLLYGGWLCGYAIQEARHEVIVAMLIFFGSSVLWPLFVYAHTLRTPNTERRIFTFFGHRPTPFWLFYFQDIFRNQPLRGVFTKVFSGAVLAGVCLLFPTDDYDQRLLYLGTLIAAVTHASLAFEAHRFAHTQLGWVRNLPLPYAKRIAYLAAEASLMMLPEVVVLVRFLPQELSWWHAVQAVIFLVAFWFFLRNSLYRKPYTLENLQGFGLGFFLGGIVLVMCGLPFGFAAEVLFLFGLFWHFRYYFKSEWLVRK